MSTEEDQDTTPTATTQFATAASRSSTLSHSGSLDALLSPRATSPTRHSTATTIPEEDADELRFSTVPLSAAGSETPIGDLNLDEKDAGDVTIDASSSDFASGGSLEGLGGKRFSDGRRQTIAVESPTRISLASTSSTPSSTLVDTEKNEDSLGDKKDRTSAGRLLPGHKKSASSASIRSFVHAPFILKQLSLRENVDGHARAHVEGAEEGARRNRISMEGQEMLKEEFERAHSQAQGQSEKVESTPGDKEEEGGGKVKEEGAIDWDFWGDVMSDYQAFAAANSERLAKAIENGVPDALRGMIWQLMAASKDPELEAIYLKLLKEPSPHEKAITRDLGRTFPHHDFFNNGQGIGQENLFNVLKAYSLYDPQVGYCQGMPFVVAILLLNMPDEEAFCLLVRLMYSYDLRGHFLPEMPKLQLRLFQFDRLVEELLPVLHVHFVRQGIKSSMFCSQWFLTLFSYRFPLEIVYRIYDNLLASGIEGVFAFSLVLLHTNETELLKCKFDETLGFLNGRVLEAYESREAEATDTNGNTEQAKPTYDVNRFVRDAVGLKITPFMLDAYAREYEDMVRARDAHAIEMDELRNSNRSLSNQVKKLEASLSQMNTEHVELLNELVKARLNNENLEEELVRYKLLYATAMHENEDAMSSHRLSSRVSINSR